MGILSPFSGTKGTPIVALRLQSTPETHQVSEFLGFDDLDLLPAAVIDSEVFPDQNTSSALGGEQDLFHKHAPTADAWPGRPLALDRLFQKNTFLELTATPREDMSEFGDEGPKQRAASEPHSPAPWIVMTPRQEKREAEASTPMGQPSDAGAAGGAATETLVPVWYWEDASGRVWAGSSEHGSMWQVPSATEPSPLSAAECACAPPPPPQGAYIPEWPYGTAWPFSHAPTTLTLNGLPREMSQEDLVELLDKFGFSGFYDFVFMPTDSETRRSRGCALVNLSRHSYGLSLAAHMHRFRASAFNSNAGLCSVEWSRPLQGLTEHMEVYREHPLNNATTPVACRPLHFSAGWQAPFPAASGRCPEPQFGDFGFR